MILIFGGTTEGKQVVQLMQTLRQAYHYSTKTKVEYEEDQWGHYRWGAFDEKNLKAYLQDHQIHCIINAAHPFASLLHSTIATVAQQSKIPVYRLKREYEAPVIQQGVYYVEDYEAALRLLEKVFQGKKLLALTGVQSIAKLKSYWQKHSTFFRILDRASSLAVAAEDHFPIEQLILAYPNNCLEKEIEVYKACGAEVILTKESGKSGFLGTKIQAALALELPIIILKRPPMPSYFRQVVSINALQRLLINLKRGQQ